MTLFIAILLLLHFQASWWLYLLTIIIWGFHVGILYELRMRHNYALDNHAQHIDNLNQEIRELKAKIEA